MTPEKWQESWSKSNILERPFLYLYRLLYVYPWQSYGVALVALSTLFVVEIEQFRESGEILAVGIFVVGVGPFFYTFGLRFAIWIMLRASGYPAEYLRY